MGRFVVVRSSTWVWIDAHETFQVNEAFNNLNTKAMVGLRNEIRDVEPRIDKIYTTLFS